MTISVSTPATTTVTEGGDGVTVTLKLFSSPASDVVIPLSTSNEQCSVSPEEITLSTANWNSGVEVTVSAVDDLWDDGDADCWLITGSSKSTTDSLDTYDPEDYLFTAIDDDATGVVITPSATEVTEGGSISLTVRLNAGPIDTVAVSLATNPTVCQPAQTVINFAPTDWKKPVTINLQTVSNPQVTGNRTCTITAATNSLDSSFNGVTVDPVEMMVTEQDVAGFELVGATQTISSGESADVFFRLTTIPLEPVTATFSSNDGCDVDRTSVVFSNSDSADDLEKVVVTPQNGSCTISVSLAGADTHYAGMVVPDISITVSDNLPSFSAYLPLIVR